MFFRFFAGPLEHTEFYLFEVPCFEFNESDLEAHVGFLGESGDESEGSRVAKFDVRGSP